VIIVYHNRNPDKAELPMREGRKATDLRWRKMAELPKGGKTHGVLGFFNRVRRRDGKIEDQWMYYSPTKTRRERR
jgi:hypothetical protein